MRHSASTAHSANAISISPRDHRALPTTNGNRVPRVTTNGVSSSSPSAPKSAARKPRSQRGAGGFAGAGAAGALRARRRPRRLTAAPRPGRGRRRARPVRLRRRRAHRADRFRDALREPLPRGPSQHPPRAPGIETSPARLAGACFAVHRLPRVPGRPRHRAEHLPYRPGRARADVEHAVAGGAQRENMRLDRVAHVHVVALGEPVAVDRRAHAVEHGAGERGNDAGLAGQTLSRPVDVGAAQDRVAHAAEPAHRPHVGLGGRLGRAVGRQRLDRSLLRRGQRRRVAVERPARGREHEPDKAHAVGETVLEYVDGAAHIDRRAPARLAHRLADAGLRHRASAPIRAISERRSADIRSARTFPPRRRPSSEGSSSTSPVAIRGDFHGTPDNVSWTLLASRANGHVLSSCD